MAGSKVVTSYESDDEVDYNVTLDETNVKLSGFGWSLGANSTATTQRRTISPSKPRPISMRYVIVAGQDADDRIVRRKLYVHDASANVWQNPETVTLTGVIPDYSTNPSGFLTNVKVTALIGEKRYILAANDTGIIDGTTGDT